MLASAIALSTTALAAVTLTTNVKDGDTISGEFTFKVAVQSESLVTSVEFYVGTDLRDTDESTPYEFKVDTLKETQGTFEVTFAAYTKSGESAKKKITLKVDNGLENGIGAALDKGKEAIANGKWDDALFQARVALKIDANDNRARILMARANLGLGVMDIAERYAEDAVNAEPGNIEALDLYSVVNLKKAFASYARGGDKTEAITAMGTALSKAAETRRKSLDLSVDNFGKVDDSNRLAYCDTLMKAGSYGRVVSELDPLFKKDFKNNDIANRLLYAQIRAGRFTAALQTLESMRKYGSMDGFGYAMKACLMAYFGNTKEALDAEKEAILNDPTGLGVQTAQAFLALRRNDTKTATNIMTRLANSQGQAPVVNYGISALAFLVADYDQSRDRFQTAMLAEPASYDMLVERGNQTVYFALRTDIENDSKYGERQRLLAKTYFDAALAARPESFEALTGLCCVAMLDGRKSDAINMGRAAVAAGPDYAAAHWAYSAALYNAGGSDQVKELAKSEAQKASKLDTNGLDGKPYPTPKTAWDYFYGRGRVPWLLGPGS